MNRRRFLLSTRNFAGAGLVGLTGCASKQSRAPVPPRLPFYDAVPHIAPIRAHEDRIFRITVCSRPFRAQGPRLDGEKVGDQFVVHNYGHGGSGWSLSWGSSALATRLAMQQAAQMPGSPRGVGVLGCGALGLTSALLLQRAGAKVTIYAKDRAPETRSSRATGSWTPDSRVALAGSAPPSFPALWEEMARNSFSMYQSYLGMAGNPIEWTDRYFLTDDEPDAPSQDAVQPSPVEFAYYMNRIQDITPHAIDLPPGSHPFPTRHARRKSSLTFNVAGYSRQLMTDFLLAGGAVETLELQSPSDLASLRHKVFINCTGYGARALWKDESIVPVRGQIAWLIPEPDVNYGFSYGNLNVLGRRDGIVVQSSEQGEATGWNNADETPDRAEAGRAVQTLAGLYSRMPKFYANISK